ncbi:unnamed protein product [Ascophyllum nodosum]
MVDVYRKKCGTESCSKRPSFGVAGTKTAEYCAQHAPHGMVDVYNKKCKAESCSKRPSFGVAGTKTAEYCAQHTLDGMVDVKPRKRKTEGSGKKLSFGVAGTTTVEFCAQHASDGMVDVKPRKLKAEGCEKKPSLGVAGTTTGEYSAQHAPDGMVDVVCENKTIGNVVPSDATVTTVHPPPTHASPPSGASRGFRKRVRLPENTCTYSKRVVARESTGGAVTMPDIDGQKPPVRRDSSVKTEAQLFF